MGYEEIEVMKKTIVDAGLYIVEPDDLERLAEDTIEEENDKKNHKFVDMIEKK